MKYVPTTLACLAVLAVSACEEIAVANDPVALAEMRGSKSCISAVKQHTGLEAALNTSIPVIETDRYIVNVQDGRRFTCVTDANGSAIEIAERRNV